MGVCDLNAYTDTHENWPNLLYDEALKFYPVGERCQNPVCHRITFMYAPLYQHEQLNELTHDTLHETFGIADITSFEGLGLMTRKGHIVAADGQPRTALTPRLWPPVRLVAPHPTRRHRAAVHPATRATSLLRTRRSARTDGVFG